jgi:hypothetical protein
MSSSGANAQPLATQGQELNRTLALKADASGSGSSFQAEAADALGAEGA